MSQFSTNETISLEKRIISTNITKTQPENINFQYEIDNCVNWILENNFQKVCLQFPDYLLPDSTAVVHNLERIINNKVYILGDSAYESCCIDYTAAKHISADAIIHFGQTCFSKSENIIPCLKIFEKFDVDEIKFFNCLSNKFTTNEDVTILINSPYLHKIDCLKNRAENKNYKILSIESDNLDVLAKNLVYLGSNDKKLFNIYLSFPQTNLFYFDPKTSIDLLKYDPDTKIIKRRYFLIEKIKDANTIGIVIGTLAVKNYLRIIERIKTLTKVHKKKYYVISVGKPTVAKLANFPEVDVFVVVGCAMNEIYENREFYKPVVTPFDFESALNPKLENKNFSYDFNKFLSENCEITDDILENYEKNDLSLITGSLRSHHNLKTDENVSSNEVLVRNDGKLQTLDNFGAGFLASRSWKGLEQDLGKSEPEMATKGRKGIAQNYDSELQ